MTKEWKTKVLSRLESNAATGGHPRSIRELARMIRADAPGVLRSLTSDQTASKYVAQICALLVIDLPMVPSPSVNDDEWAAAVAEIRAQPMDRQRLALELLRTIVKRLDSE